MSGGGEMDKRFIHYISFLSHEMRVPLSLIKNALDLVINGIVKDEKAKEVMIVAQKNVDRLIGMISDNLDLTRLETGKREYHFVKADLFHEVEQIISDFKQRADALNIQLKNKVPQSLPPLCVDQNALHQILINVMDNALKFTPHGGTITIGANSIQKKNRDHIGIFISDTGCGIEKKDLKNIFEIYYQPLRTQAINSKGLGLGLPIVKSLIMAHRGKIWVKSEVGKGTTFWFTLPQYVEIKERITPIIEKRVLPKELEILIIDDEGVIVQFMTELLRRKGHRTTGCESGFEAINVLERRHFDLVFCDLIMPGMNGVETLRKIKAKDPSLRVVMMTGYADEQSLSAAEQLGGFVGIPKPFDISDIDLVIEKAKKMDDATFRAWLKEARIGLFEDRRRSAA